jgi:hypothetical protein
MTANTRLTAYPLKWPRGLPGQSEILSGWFYPFLLPVEVRGLLRASRQLGSDAGQATTREGLDLLQGGWI